jgi:hypothetical protein
MKISTTHKKFADRLWDQPVLEYPERFLGPNWKNVLNFWIYLDTLSAEDTDIIHMRYLVLGEDAIVYAENHDWKAARDTIGFTYADATCHITFTFPSIYTTLELIGSHNLEYLTFLPLFLKHKI